jgi:hypothetical protein
VTPRRRPDLRAAAVSSRHARRPLAEGTKVLILLPGARRPTENDANSDDRQRWQQSVLRADSVWCVSF